MADRFAGDEFFFLLSSDADSRRMYIDNGYALCRSGTGSPRPAALAAAIRGWAGRASSPSRRPTAGAAAPGEGSSTTTTPRGQRRQGPDGAAAGGEEAVEGEVAGAAEDAAEVADDRCVAGGGEALLDKYVASTYVIDGPISHIIL
eukprot:scaffold112832_cov28-Prasinocladus_malaysianus.AAC.1